MTAQRGAAPQHVLHLAIVEMKRARAADAGGYAGGERVGQLLLYRLNVGPCQAGEQRAHAAGDIEPDAAGGYDSALFRRKCRNAADRKAVAPMGVRHGIGAGNDAGQGGDVNHLRLDLVVHVGNQIGRRVEHGGHAHVAARRIAPLGLRHLDPTGRVHAALRCLSAQTSTTHCASQFPGEASATRNSVTVAPFGSTAGWCRGMSTDSPQASARTCRPSATCTW